MKHIIVGFLLLLSIFVPTITYATTITDYLILLGAPTALLQSAVINNPCTGEKIILNGEINTQISTDYKDNKLILKYKTVPKAIAGVGETSNNNYIVVGAGINKFTISTTELQDPILPLTLSLVDHYRIISQGNSDNFSIDVVFKLVIDKDNNLNVVVDKFDNPICRG